MTTQKLIESFKKHAEDNFDATTAAKKILNFNTLLEVFPASEEPDEEWTADDLVLLLAGAVAE